MTTEETLDLLKNSLELLEKHPPVYKRPYDRPHGGERDCGACGYPLTNPGPKAGTHEEWVSPSYSSNRGQRCPWVQTTARLKAAVSDLETEVNEFDPDVERAEGPCGEFKPQYTGTNYCTCLWTKAAHQGAA